jgi:hypothetical protein
VRLPKQVSPDGHPIYWKLNKTLYGLRESPRAFYDDCSNFLLEQGFRRTEADPCMFYRRDERGVVLMVVHVDDFAIATSTPELADEVFGILRKRYEITTKSAMDSFLGIYFDYLPDGRIRISQPVKIDELIQEHGLPKGVYPSVPMDSKFNDFFQDDAPAVDVSRFMHLLGQLMYLVKTRPDITYAINRMATRAPKQTSRDYDALLRILWYLGATPTLGIIFSPANTADMSRATRLFCFVDAAYATHLDSKSHSGFCFGFGDSTNSMFYARSAKQANVALSSTEAEHDAATEATKEILWLRTLLEELGFPQKEATVLFADSQPMIKLAEDFSGNHKRVKHYITRINFLLDQVRAETIAFEHVSTELNVADILTKPLGPQQFLALRKALMGESTIIFFLNLLALSGCSANYNKV